MDASPGRSGALLGAGLLAASFIAAAAFAQEGGEGTGGGGGEAGDLPSFFQPFPIFGDGSPIPLTAPTPSGALFPLGFGGSRRLGFHWFINQTANYDDNVRRLSLGRLPPAGRSKDDLFFVTTLGASYRERVGLHQVFLNAAVSQTRHVENSDLDKRRYSLTAGIDWRLGHVCNGTLSGTIEQQEQEIETTFNNTGTGTVATQSVNYAGRCHIFGRFYGTYGLSWRKSDYSQTPLSNLQQLSANAGIEYSLPRLHTLGFRFSHTLTDYDNGAARLAANLGSETVQRDYTWYYDRRISPKTSFRVSGGFSELSSTGIGGTRTVLVPTWAASVAWRPTAKISMQVRAEQRASPAQGTNSDYQEVRSLAASLAYTYSRKLSFVASATRSRNESPSFLPVLGVPTSRITNVTSFGLDANYSFDTFLTASLGYRYTERTDKSTGDRSRSNLYTLRVQYQR